MLPAREPPSGGLSARFFGSSSFLFEDANSQILVDGFFTRSRLWFVKRISPDLRQIREMVDHAGICMPLADGEHDLQGGICRSVWS